MWGSECCRGRDHWRAKYNKKRLDYVIKMAIEILCWRACALPQLYARSTVALAVTKVLLPPLWAGCLCVTRLLQQLLVTFCTAVAIKSVVIAGIWAIKWMADSDDAVIGYWLQKYLRKIRDCIQINAHFTHFISPFMAGWVRTAWVCVCAFHRCIHSAVWSGAPSERLLGGTVQPHL